MAGSRAPLASARTRTPPSRAAAYWYTEWSCPRLRTAEAGCRYSGSSTAATNMPRMKASSARLDRQYLLMESFSKSALTRFALVQLLLEEQRPPRTAQWISVDKDDWVTRTVVLIIEIDIAGVFLSDINIWHGTPPSVFVGWSR